MLQLLVRLLQFFFFLHLCKCRSPRFFSSSFCCHLSTTLLSLFLLQFYYLLGNSCESPFNDFFSSPSGVRCQPPFFTFSRIHHQAGEGLRQTCSSTLSSTPSRHLSLGGWGVAYQISCKMRGDEGSGDI